MSGFPLMYKHLRFTINDNVRMALVDDSALYDTSSVCNCLKGDMLSITRILFRPTNRCVSLVRFATCVMSVKRLRRALSNYKCVQCSTPCKEVR